MLQRLEPQVRRYSAFLSYSRTDVAFARRLQRRLEGYRLPSRLKGATGSVNGRRLRPVFRDDDELVAGHDLTEAVREAIGLSDHLIVICSPRAAQSNWVAREIELFRHHHGGQNILAALIEGEPDEAFPPAMRRRPHGRLAEPLAADFRPEAGADRMALLKLVAPLAGVGLDDLIHRDAQRRMRQVLTVSAAAAATVAVVAGLSIVTLNARNEAALQARRASGLGDFMVSDLRKGLEEAGRHDLLKQVNEAALKSYETADLSKLTPDQILQLAKGLQGAAKDAEKAGDLNAARQKADAGYRITANLLAAKPGDPQRIFAHAQSEYWSGFISWREGNGAAAKARFEAYAQLADRLSARDRANADWAMERVYAAQNLGALALRQANDPAQAEHYFRTALDEIEPIVRNASDDTDALTEKQRTLAWLADCQRLQGHLSDAAATREAQEQVLQGMLSRNPRNIEIKAQLLFHDLAVARIASAQGRTSSAASLLEAGHRHALDLAADDPDNKDFPKLARMFELFEVRLWLDPATKIAPPSARIAKVLGDCGPVGTGAGAQEIDDFCRTLLARLRLSRGDAAGAAAALVPVRLHLANQHDVLTPRWGLDMAAEARPVQLAMGGTK